MIAPNNRSLRDRFLAGLVLNVVEPTPAYSDDFPATDFLSSAEFLSADFKLEWLVKPVLVRGQPGVIGGPLKSLKTSVLVDLAVSLATETPALGRFQVPEQRRVGIISGESGGERLQWLYRAVCDAKRILQPEDIGVYWQFTLPQLTLPEDLESLADKIRRHKLDVVIIDPLYLCLLAGASNLQAANMFDVGPRLKKAADACLCEGCTPIFVHHFNREGARRNDPPELHELAFAGLDLFVRQWWLLRRRERYSADGMHKLWLNIGGSSGFSSCWAVDIDEGQLGESDGRHWSVETRPEHEERRTAAEEKEAEKQEKQAAELDRLRAKATTWFLKHPAGDTVTGLAKSLGVDPRKVTRVIDSMLEDGLLKPRTVKKPAGRGGSRAFQGYAWVGERG